MSGNNVIRFPTKLRYWERRCIHDIVDICKAENIPIQFGMRHYHALRLLYAPGTIH